jgi:hypothetical protein
MKHPVVDEAPKSAFVREMEAAIARRLAASGPGKKAVDREIAAIVKQYLGRDAWRAMVDADREAEAGVPRTTTGPRSHRARATPGRGGRYSDTFDHKLAQSGEREGDD